MSMGVEQKRAGCFPQESIAHSEYFLEVVLVKVRSGENHQVVETNLFDSG